MKLSFAGRRGQHISAIALALIFQAAWPSAAKTTQQVVTTHWEDCKPIPKYPNEVGAQYSTYPSSGRQEDIVSEVTHDSIANIVDFYKKALPGWIYRPPKGQDPWPLEWKFYKKGNIRLSVRIRRGVPTNAIDFECYSVNF